MRGWTTARATGATPVTRALLGALSGVSGLLCGPYRTGKEAVEGLGLPLSHGVPAVTMHRASGCLRNLTPPALSRAAVASLLTPVSVAKLSVRPKGIAGVVGAVTEGAAVGFAVAEEAQKLHLAPQQLYAAGHA